jgi:hypothetical protein
MDLAQIMIHPSFSRDDVIVAFATQDGALTAEDGTFRMVIPDGEGKQTFAHWLKFR